MKSYTIIAVMSGTSLDGLDIACCTFEKTASWQGKIIKAVTLPYPGHWMKKLQSLMQADAETLAMANVEYGHYIGEQIQKFILDHKLKPDLIASHGHTIFHQPEKQFTLQIGDGNAIAAHNNLPVVFDFRSLDVALGGQGAPLVPIGDRHLFSAYEYCLNLGGIANVSFESQPGRIAFDICPVNMLLNYLSEKIGLAYDRGGTTASRGNINLDLLNVLNELEYYRIKGIKTLGREWFEANIVPLFVDCELSIKDQLRTAVEHIAIQVSNAIHSENEGKLLISGGGALNDFLISRIKALTPLEVIVPPKLIIDFKEAYIFAFLGLLRIRGEVNCLSTVTGASRDSCSGTLIQ